MDNIIKAIIKKLDGVGHQITITKELTPSQIAILRAMGFKITIDGFGITIRS